MDKLLQAGHSGLDPSGGCSVNIGAPFLHPWFRDEVKVNSVVLGFVVILEIELVAPSVPLFPLHKMRM